MTSKLQELVNFAHDCKKWPNLLGAHIAIPYGTAIRCAGLTTITDENKHQSISDRYPRLHKALRAAGLILPDKKLPTFGELLSKRDRDAAKAAAKRAKNKKRDPRQIYIKQK